MSSKGATIWSRKTINSEIFVSKPDKWFKIWFFLVNRVNFHPTTRWGRGECFIPSGEIERSTGATPDQVKKCLKWLRDEHSLSTKRSTRGIHIKVLKYNIYQDLGNYRSTREALEKHQRSTTIGEIINNNNTSEQSSVSKNNDMSWKKYSDEYEEGVVDLESGELHNPEEEKKKQESELKKRFRESVDWLIKHQGRDPKRTAVPKQLKAIQKLYTMGVSAKEAKQIIMECEGSPIWQGRAEKPDYWTVVSIIQKRG